MKPVVIDSSATGAWLMPDEQSHAAQELYVQAVQSDDLFHVPLLWSWEMGNLLTMGVARKRIVAEQLELGLELLGTVQLNFDAPLTPHRQAQVGRLALTHGLTFYDATYLELVLRLNGQLASLDRKLVAAAKACGIVCLTF